MERFEPYIRVNLLHLFGGIETNRTITTRIFTENQYSKLAASSKEQVFERIKHERAIEFAAEGLRYNDLKRWGLLEKLTNGQKQNDVLGNTLSTKATVAKNNLWPIPYTEIDMNNKLEQNPGW